MYEVEAGPAPKPLTGEALRPPDAQGLLLRARPRDNPSRDTHTRMYPIVAAFAPELAVSDIAFTPGPDVTGTWELDIVSPDGAALPAGVFYVAAKSFDTLRTTHEAALDALKPDTADLRRAIAICRARTELLSDKPSSRNSAQFMTDLTLLSADVRDEIGEIARGRNPYSRRIGDHWRIVGMDSSGGSGTPARVYAPKEAAGEQLLPLVIALHGAGGDESMFPEGYGAGIIKSLADQHRFILISPANGPFSGGGEFFDRIVESVSADYPVDPRRIYVVGHSMGGGVTTALAKSRSDKIAAACAIAGFGGAKAGTKIAPMLVIAAELDMLMPIARARKTGEAAAASGLPIEFRVLENYGHTLAVGAALPDVIPWLLKHKLQD